MEYEDRIIQALIDIKEAIKELSFTMNPHKAMIECPHVWIEHRDVTAPYRQCGKCGRYEGIS